MTVARSSYRLAVCRTACCAFRMKVLHSRQTESTVVGMQDLAAENMLLRQALRQKQLMLKKKELQKAHKALEQLRLRHRLQEAEAENKELKGVARQVLNQCNTYYVTCSVFQSNCLPALEIFIINNRSSRICTFHRHTVLSSEDIRHSFVLV